MAKTTDKKAGNTDETKVNAEEKAMDYTTAGTIKSLNLTDNTFTLEPISKYRFEVKDDDENAWKIIFKEANEKEEPTSLRLIPRDAQFKFTKSQQSAMIILKQSKTHIRISAQITKDNATSLKVKAIEVP